MTPSLLRKRRVVDFNEILPGRKPPGPDDNDPLPPQNHHIHSPPPVPTGGAVPLNGFQAPAAGTVGQRGGEPDEYGLPMPTRALMISEVRHSFPATTARPEGASAPDGTGVGSALHPLGCRLSAGRRWGTARGKPACRPVRHAAPHGGRSSCRRGTRRGHCLTAARVVRERHHAASRAYLPASLSGGLHGWCGASRRGPAGSSTSYADRCCYGSVADRACRLS